MRAGVPLNSGANTSHSKGALAWRKEEELKTCVNGKRTKGKAVACTGRRETELTRKQRSNETESGIKQTAMDKTWGPILSIAAFILA